MSRTNLLGALALFAGVALIASKAGAKVKETTDARLKEIANATVLPESNNRLSMEGVTLNAPSMGDPTGPGGKLI